MKSIVLKKLEVVEIQTVQSDLLEFITYKNSTLTHHKKDDFSRYFSELLILDIASKLYYSFRSKIEKSNKSIATITLTPSEAIVLLESCNFNNSMRNHYTKFTVLKISNLIHAELINI